MRNGARADEGQVLELHADLSGANVVTNQRGRSHLSVSTRCWGADLLAVAVVASGRVLAVLLGMSALVWIVIGAASAHTTFNLPVLSSQPFVMLTSIPLVACAWILARSGRLRAAVAQLRRYLVAPGRLDAPVRPSAPDVAAPVAGPDRDSLSAARSG